LPATNPYELETFLLSTGTGTKVFVRTNFIRAHLKVTLQALIAIVNQHTFKRHKQNIKAAIKCNVACLPLIELRDLQIDKLPLERKSANFPAGNCVL